MAGKIDSELIEFLHKMLDTLGAPALHADLDKLNGDVADDIKDGDVSPEKHSDPVKPAPGAPVISTSKP
jgi:hypothetical protein